MSSERNRVLAAVPVAGRDHAALPVLATLDPVAVAHVAVDPSEAWWRRRPCARSLDGRVPAQMVGALWDRVTAKDEVAEVRRELLAVLVSHWVADPQTIDPQREAAVAWLREVDPRELGYGVEEAIVLARARLGDLGVAPALASLVYDPWSHRNRVGIEALAALVARQGRASLLHAFGCDDVHQLVTRGSTAAARYLGLALMMLEGNEPDPPTLFSALADEDIVVAQHASQLLQGSAVAEPQLLAVFDEHREALLAAASTAPPLTGRPAAAAWALLAAAGRSLPWVDDDDDDDAAPRGPSPEVRERLGAVVGCEVPLPDVPRDVRRAILGAHLPGQRTTDPRHLLEGLELPRLELDAQPELPHRARAALVEAGLPAGLPQPIGELYGQGGGSFDVIEVSGTSLWVCTFGPFLRAEPPLPAEALAALERAGFRWIDAELASRIFDGLGVYYFGDRDPLTVQNLLMYWQD